MFKISKLELHLISLGSEFQNLVADTSKVLAPSGSLLYFGQMLEGFARERRVGADSWRRTGLLTFSANVKRGPKITYSRIKDHLEKTYNTKFGYGTVVQLCSVHNKRKLSSRRYCGAAQLVSRRTRKGFNVKFNVDAKRSCSMYRLQDHI